MATEREIHPRKCVKSRERLSDAIFAETMISTAIIINPEFINDNFWDYINWQEENCGIEIEHDKNLICEFASLPVFIDGFDGFFCAAKFRGNPTIYDLSPNIIMDNNAWYRRGIIKYVSKDLVTEKYVTEWMTQKCKQVIKYKKKIKKIKRKVSLTTAEIQTLIAQYGAFLGYNIYSTLNPIGIKKQQKKLVKMPIIIFDKTSLFNSLISKDTLYYIKNDKHIFNTNKYKILYSWLRKEYVMKKDEYGLWSITQSQVSYTTRSQMLMIKYDVHLRDNKRNTHYIYRDLNYDNPKYLYYKQVELLVFGYTRVTRQYSMPMPVVLVQLVLKYRYDEDVYKTK